MWSLCNPAITVVNSTSASQFTYELTRFCNAVFSYDNSTHSVYRLGTASDFTSCNLGTVIPGGSFHSGQDIVFLSTPDTYYFVCGAPSHCKQGMKFALSATGSPISAPPPPPVGSDAAAPGSQASLTVTRPGSVSLSICISVAAFVSIFL